MTHACTPCARALGLVAALLGGATGPALAPRTAGAAGVAPVAGSPADATGAGSTVEERRARARADLRARRFVAAADGFEALWRERGEPGDREQAAEARAGAGHRFHALEHWREILTREPGPDAARRAAIERRVATARQRTAPLRVTVATSGRGPIADVRLAVRRVEADDPRPAVEVSVADEAGRVLELDAGVWSLTALAPGHQPVQRVLTIAAPGPEQALELVLPVVVTKIVLALEPAAAVAAGAVWSVWAPNSDAPLLTLNVGAREHMSLGPGVHRLRVEAPGFVAQELTWRPGDPDPAVTLVPAPGPDPAPVRAPVPPTLDPRLGLGLGLGVGAAVSLGLGVGLLVQHRERYAHFEAAPNNAGFVAGLTASNAGSGFVGAGVGLAAVAFTTGGIRGWVASDNGLWAELAVGGGVALIGSAWYAREWQRVQKDLYDGNHILPGDPDMDGAPIGHDVTSQRRETAAAAVIGAGAGLMIGAGVALLTRTLIRLRGRKSGRVARLPFLSSGPGFTVRGQF